MTAVAIPLLCEWIALTNQLDRTRSGLDPDARLRYTKLRYKILKDGGRDVSAEDIGWLRQKITETATK